MPHWWLVASVVGAVAAGVGIGQAARRQLGDEDESSAHKNRVAEADDEKTTQSEAPTLRGAAQKTASQIAGTASSFVAHSANEAARAAVRHWWQRKRKKKKKKNPNT